MAKPAIRVEGLWKEYVIGAQQKAHGTFYDMLSSSLAAPFRALRGRTAEEQAAESFWALRDVNFEVQPGEVVGIIGRNGAGKSTLLKILSRITAPTRGHVEVRGRLASLLEVGTGFHPELSGRENIFLNGAILGMTRAEVARKFDEIVAFAEVEKFVDTPVKRYSSGMYVRLAFSVAAHLETEVLVVDEVLAVGDSSFQKKCIRKMQDVSDTGNTVLFVSHNLPAIETLCRSAVLLEGGRVVSQGPAQSIVRAYEMSCSTQLGTIIVDKHVVRVRTVEAQYGWPDDSGRVVVRLEFDALDDVDDLFVDFALETTGGTRLAQIVPQARDHAACLVARGGVYLYSVDFVIDNLAPNDYRGTFYWHSVGRGPLLLQTEVPLFRISSNTSTPEAMSAGFTAVLVPPHSSSIAASTVQRIQDHDH